MKICCIGIAVQDRIFTVKNLPQNEGKFFANNFREQGGGPAATAAVAIAKLGGEVDMIARIGADATGKAILEELEQYGVGTQYMRIIDGACSTQASITVDSQGKRIIISYPSPSLIPDADFLDHIDFSQYDLILADVRWHQGALKAFEIAKKLNIPTVLDADITDQPIDELVALSSHAIFSEPGLKKFTKLEDIDSALKKASVLTSGQVYVTLGENGYKFLDNSEIVHKLGFKVNVVDTTGAGDVFHGAFSYALGLKNNVVDCLNFAAATAALKCTKPGGRTGIPSYDEVKYLIQN